MINSIFSLLSEADQLRQEREKVARKRPDLVLVDKRPDPQMFAWRDPAELWERRS